MHRTLFIIAVLISAATPALAQMAASMPEQNNSVEQAVLKVTQEWLVADERHDAVQERHRRTHIDVDAIRRALSQSRVQRLSQHAAAAAD